MSATADTVAAHLTAHLTGLGYGAPSAASVTFLGLEPMRVLRFAREDGRQVLASVGCSRHPMTDPNALVQTEDGPRAEVLIRVRPSAPVELAGVHRTVAVLTADALVDLGQPLWEGAPFTAVLLADSVPNSAEGDTAEGVPDCAIVGSSPVRFLEAVPITANEAAWVRLKGADALRAAWAEAGIDPANPARPAAQPR
jgi:hypothetical protein